MTQSIRKKVRETEGLKFKKDYKEDVYIDTMNVSAEIPKTTPPKLEVQKEQDDWERKNSVQKFISNDI